VGVLVDDAIAGVVLENHPDFQMAAGQVAPDVALPRDEAGVFIPRNPLFSSFRVISFSLDCEASIRPS
jgi:hypothetical protein